MKRFCRHFAAACLVPLLSTVAYANPVTGDSGVGVWVALMGVAAVVLGAVIFLMVRKGR